jgi:hypothetical protein
MQRLEPSLTPRVARLFGVLGDPFPETRRSIDKQYYFNRVSLFRDEPSLLIVASESVQQPPRNGPSGGEPRKNPARQRQPRPAGDNRSRERAALHRSKVATAAMGGNKPEDFS